MPAHPLDLFVASSASTLMSIYGPLLDTIDPALLTLRPSESEPLPQVPQTNTRPSSPPTQQTRVSRSRPATVNQAEPPSRMPAASTSPRPAPAPAHRVPSLAGPGLAHPDTGAFRLLPAPPPAPDALTTVWATPSPALSPLTVAGPSTSSAASSSGVLFPAQGDALPSPPARKSSSRKRASRTPSTAAPLSAPLPTAAPISPLPAADPALKHGMEETAARALAKTVRRDAAGDFACPIPGCGKLMGARTSLERHLKAHTVVCPQGCPKPVKRGSDRETMKRHLERFCRKTPKEVRERNSAIAKAKALASKEAKTRKRLADNAALPADPLDGSESSQAPPAKRRRVDRREADLPDIIS